MKLLNRTQDIAVKYKYEKFPYIELMEKEIIEMLIDGMTQTEIAQQMEVSKALVNSRLVSIRRRTFTRTNIELCVKYLVCPHVVR